MSNTFSRAVLPLDVFGGLSKTVRLALRDA